MPEEIDADAIWYSFLFLSIPLGLYLFDALTWKSSLFVVSVFAFLVTLMVIFMAQKDPGEGKT